MHRKLTHQRPPALHCAVSRKLQGSEVHWLDPSTRADERFDWGGALSQRSREFNFVDRTKLAREKGAKGEVDEVFSRMEAMHSAMQDSIINNASEDFTEINVYRQGYASWRRGKGRGAKAPASSQM